MERRRGVGDPRSTVGRGARARAANAERNGLGNVETRDANVFDLLHELDKREERFDTP
jgi:hypothetical protein